MYKKGGSNPINRIDNKYNIEEFEVILSFLDHHKLIEPIKKYPKEFKEIAGFRPDTLSYKQLFEIYYKRIYKKEDKILTKHMSKLIFLFLKGLDDEITEKLETAENVRKKLENNDMDCFKELIKLILKNKVHTNIALYFKMVDYKLTVDQKLYCDNELKERIVYAKIEKNLKEKIKKEYDQKIYDYKTKYDKLNSEKSHEVKKLHRKLKEEHTCFEKELEKKNVILKHLKEEIENYKVKILDINKIHENEIDKLKNQMSIIDIESVEIKKKCDDLSELVTQKQVEFNKYAQKEWNKKNEEIILLKESMEQELSNLQLKKNAKYIEIEELNVENSKLLNSKEIIEKGTRNVIDNIKEVYNLFGNEQKNYKQDSSLYIEQSVEVQINAESINNKSDYIDDLQTNIEIAGIKKEYSYAAARYIYSSFASKMGLILVGADARKIANAISEITCSRSADIISIPPGYGNCKELVETIKVLKSNIVLIENGLDSIYESVYLPLLKSNINKRYIFSVEDQETINLIPKAILNYLMIINLDSIITFQKDEEFLHEKTVSSVFENESDSGKKICNLKKLESFDQIEMLPNSLKMKISEVMTIIDQLPAGESMQDIIVMYFSLFARTSKKHDALMEIIEEQEFNPNILKSLNIAIGVN